jgi:dipeptidyl aminopeptidase/acylaminoacyl peptidase
MLKALQTDEHADWKQRFQVPVISWTQIAAQAPDRGLAVSNRSGVYQLYAWDVPTGGLTQLTDLPTGKSSGRLSPDGRYIYYLLDAQGNEIGHYVRVPFAGGTPEDLTPDLPPYPSMGLALARGGTRLAFLMADAAGFHLYVLDCGPGAPPGPPRDVHHSAGLMLQPVLSYDGALAAIASSERAGHLHFSTLVLDVAGGEIIGELEDGPDSSVEPVMFAPLPGDSRLLATTNRSGTTRPVIWNPRTGERTDLDLSEIAGEVQPLDWSADGAEILLCQVHQAQHQLYIYDLAAGQLRRLQHPAGSFTTFPGGGTYFGPDGTIFAQWQNAGYPSRLIALDRATGTLQRPILTPGDVPPGHAWRSITCPSSDGQMIQGWLGVPDGDGPFPTILETHGGPTSVMAEHFDPESQAWLDHGFAFLTINYRGSTTFGPAFEEQIWGDLGHWEIEDMAAAHAWLVENGIALADQVLLTGWSYGGYLTLLGLGKRPDLWAGGMAGVAIADWTLLYEDEADTLKGYQAALFGGTPEEKAAEYAAGSPLTYAEAVVAPVLVIQGRNDTRCPSRQLEVYEARLKALGKPIEVDWFDAGHGSLATAQRIAFQERMLRFAYRVLGA